MRVAVVGKLRWIKRQRAAFERQASESSREMISGESHYFRGQRHRFELVEVDGPGKVELRGQRILVLFVPPEWTGEERELLLHRWYRARLRELVPPLLEKWQRKLGATAREWRIKRMKTKWGSCNAKARRIWLNLELAKKPPACLEYVLVHELAHLVARKHDDRFLSLMNRHLPSWRHRRIELNAAPLANETWGC